MAARVAEAAVLRVVQVLVAVAGLGRLRLVALEELLVRVVRQVSLARQTLAEMDLRLLRAPRRLRAQEVLVARAQVDPAVRLLQHAHLVAVVGVAALVAVAVVQQAQITVVDLAVVVVVLW